MQPLVTIIIPCFNYGRFLSDALDSIYAQTYEAWECLVVDDGSTDNTKEVAGRYVQQDARFRYLFQNNSGVSSARNTALKEAKGAYIQLLDADDLIESNKIKLQVAFFNEHPEVDLIYSSMLFFKDNKTNTSQPRLLHNKKGVSGSNEKIITELLDDNIFLPGCVLFTRSLYNDVGCFKTGIEGIEDWDYFYRAALLQKVFYHDERDGTRLLVRSHDTNASSNGFKMLTNKIKARRGLMHNTTKLLQDNPAAVSQTFVNKACHLHKALLNRDSARLHLYYANMLKGCIYMLQHAYYSKKIYFAFYDGAYWIKERFKNRQSKLAEQ